MFLKVQLINVWRSQWIPISRLLQLSRIQNPKGAIMQLAARAGKSNFPVVTECTRCSTGFLRQYLIFVICSFRLLAGTDRLLSCNGTLHNCWKNGKMEYILEIIKWTGQMHPWAHFQSVMRKWVCFADSISNVTYQYNHKSRVVEKSTSWH